MHKLQVLVRHLNGLLCRDWHRGESLGIEDAPISDHVWQHSQGTPLEPSQESGILHYLSFNNTHTFYLVITYLKLPILCQPLAPWSLSCEIEDPSRCYPTLPIRILWQVPVGMQIPNPTPMIKTSEKVTEGRDPQVLRQSYAHILVCGTPPSWRS